MSDKTQYDIARDKDYEEPPRTEWGELAIMSAADDPYEYEDIHGAVKDLENWKTIQEQIIVPFETYDDFPAEGPFDGAKAEAKDMNVVFQWDGDLEDWKPLNTGTPDAPIPGTSHHEAVSANDVYVDSVDDESENAVPNVEWVKQYVAEPTGWGEAAWGEGTWGGVVAND